MDPSPALLMFVEPRVGQVFGVVLVSGLMLAGSVYLLRSWPPQRRESLSVLALLVVAAIALAALLREHRIEIDLTAREVRESTQVFGLGPVQGWPFAQIKRLGVDYPGFDLAIETPAGWRRLRGFDDVRAAEASALNLAAAGPWPVVRRGYRLQTKAQAGDPQRFQTADGKHGLMFDFADAVRVVPTPGEESPLEPRR